MKHKLIAKVSSGCLRYRSDGSSSWMDGWLDGWLAVLLLLCCSADKWFKFNGLQNPPQCKSRSGSRGEYLDWTDFRTDVRMNDQTRIARPQYLDVHLNIRIFLWAADDGLCADHHPSDMSAICMWVLPGYLLWLLARQGGPGAAGTLSVCGVRFMVIWLNAALMAPAINLMNYTHPSHWDGCPSLPCPALDPAERTISL